MEKKRNESIVYLTRNTEYHTQDSKCIAVRNRTTGKWNTEHEALGLKIAGGLEFTEDGPKSQPGVPDIGHSICFSGKPLVTSHVVAVRRVEGITYPEIGVTAA